MRGGKQEATVTEILDKKIESQVLTSIVAVLSVNWPAMKMIL